MKYLLIIISFWAGMNLLLASPDDSVHVEHQINTNSSYAWGARNTAHLYASLGNIQGDLKNANNVKPYGWGVGVDYYHALFPYLLVGGGLLVENFNFKDGIYGERVSFFHITTTVNVRYQFNSLFKLKTSVVYPYSEFQLGFMAITANPMDIEISSDLVRLKDYKHLLWSIMCNLKLGVRFAVSDWISIDVAGAWIIPFTSRDFLDFCDPSSQALDKDYPDYADDYKFAANIGIIAVIKGKQDKYALINSRTRARQGGRRRPKINKSKLFK